MTEDRKIIEREREWLMEQPQFQRFLLDVLEQSGIGVASREERQSLFLEGKRSLGLHIFRLFGDDPFAVIATALQARKTNPERSEQ